VNENPVAGASGAADGLVSLDKNSTFLTKSTLSPSL
jgi:hypothetical protein